MSLASFACGSKEVVAVSIALSIAVLIISAIRTNAIERRSAISSSSFTPEANATTSTTTATRKWMRMFRCVRRTWMTTSRALLKLSRSDGTRRGVLIRRGVARASASRRRARSRAGAGARARAAPATRRARPRGTARRRRAGAAPRRAALRNRRPGTRGRRSPRARRGVRSSAPQSALARRTGRRPPPPRGPRRRARGAPARPRPSRRPAPASGSTPRRRPRGSAPALRAGLLGVQLVRLHDPLDELVSHDVLVPEADECDAVDRGEDVLHLDQPRGLLARQVDLGHVAGDDHLGAEAEPRQEHLHLLRARVLRLVEDDEGVVQGAAAHEGERRDLDLAAFHVRGEPVGVEHVVERVEERPQ